MAYGEGVHVGHVHLKVSDLEQSIRFYRDALGLSVVSRWHGAAFLSFDGYHHHLGLNTWESLGGGPPPRSSTGLYHAAWLYPSRLSLSKALRRLLEHGVRLDGASDHGVSEALYLHDPDGNGIELYADRDPKLWPRHEDGSLAMTSEPLDLDALLALSDGA